MEAKDFSRIKLCLCRESFQGKTCGLVLFELEEEGKEKRMDGTLNSFQGQAMELRCKKANTIVGGSQRV